jgi:hypothetical protein
MNTSTTTAPIIDLRDLEPGFHGRLLTPDDAEYEAAVKTQSDPVNLLRGNHSIPPMRAG